MMTEMTKIDFDPLFIKTFLVASALVDIGKDLQNIGLTQDDVTRSEEIQPHIENIAFVMKYLHSSSTPSQELMKKILRLVCIAR